MPFYKMDESFFTSWKTEINNFAKNGVTDVYAENALNKILQKVHLYPCYYSNHLCMEIDTPNDLSLAQSLIQGK